MPKQLGFLLAAGLVASYIAVASGSASAYTSRVDNGTGDGAVQAADLASLCQPP